MKKFFARYTTKKGHPAFVASEPLKQQKDLGTHAFLSYMKRDIPTYHYCHPNEYNPEKKKTHFTSFLYTEQSRYHKAEVCRLCKNRLKKAVNRGCAFCVFDFYKPQEWAEDFFRQAFLQEGYTEIPFYVLTGVMDTINKNHRHVHPGEIKCTWDTIAQNLQIDAEDAGEMEKKLTKEKCVSCLYLEHDQHTCLLSLNKRGCRGEYAFKPNGYLLDFPLNPPLIQYIWLIGKEVSFTQKIEKKVLVQPGLPFYETRYEERKEKGLVAGLSREGNVLVLHQTPLAPPGDEKSRPTRSGFPYYYLMNKLFFSPAPLSKQIQEQTIKLLVLLTERLYFGWGCVYVNGKQTMATNMEQIDVQTDAIYLTINKCRYTIASEKDLIRLFPFAFSFHNPMSADPQQQYIEKESVQVTSTFS